MTSNIAEKLLSSDKPLIKPEDDLLGYAPFAKNLALSICQATPTDGLVFALYAKWGAGKTSVLNFIEEYIKVHEHETERPIVIHFNPWWFSGRDDLMRRFFDQIQATLGRKTKKGFEKLAVLTSAFANLISIVPITGSDIPKKLTEFFPDLNERDADELNKRIRAELRNQDRRMLIIIDDIDRLSGSEIRELFRVIKAVADYPNTIYLLAFDKEVVAKALEEVQGISGEAFLEKIVQVPFELPPPAELSLPRILFNALDTVLQVTDEPLWDRVHFGNIYHDGVKHFIMNVRDIVRLTNALTVTYPAVKGEVNPVDFIAVETLRIFCPTAYEIIRKNSKMFTGSFYDFRYSQTELEEFKKFHQEWITKLPQKEKLAVKRLIERLFPKLENVDNPGLILQFNLLSDWRRQLRVCSPEIFDIYFQLSVPSTRVSNIEMSRILDSLDDTDSFTSELIELSNQRSNDGRSRLSSFLERIKDYTDIIPKINVPTFTRILLDLGDTLTIPSDERPFVPFDDNATKIERAISFMLLRFEESLRFDILITAFTASKSISILVDFIFLLGHQHRKYGREQSETDEQKIIINIDHFTELEAITLTKVRASAKENDLLGVPKLRAILAFWRLHDLSEAAHWIETIAASDQDLLRLLEQFLVFTDRQVITNTVSEKYYRLDPKWFESYIEPSIIADRLMKLPHDIPATKNQTLAMMQFLKEYQIRANGKDPEYELD